MLSDTYTLNVGSPAADVVFNVSTRNNNESVYYADSPNGDLAGRYSLRVSNEETSGGLVRTLVQFKKPYQVGGEYGQHVQANVTLTRPAEASLTDVDEILEMVQECWALDTNAFRAKIGEAES